MAEEGTFAGWLLVIIVMFFLFVWFFVCFVFYESGFDVLVCQHHFFLSQLLFHAETLYAEIGEKLL